jgi:hypothetical protein
MGEIDEIGRLRDLVTQSRYIGKKNRATFFVDGTNGLDTNPGTTPDRAVATIGQAITLAGAGDLIRISEDTYDEAVSIPAGLAGLEIFCEPGVILNNTTPGTVVSIAAPSVHWTGGLISQAGQIGFDVSGITFRGDDIMVGTCTTSFLLTGAGPMMQRCRSLLHTVTAFDIQNLGGFYERCVAFGTPATRGFYISVGVAHGNLLFQCHSINNSGGGYEMVAGADENMTAFCTQSELCGGPIDAGANNSWVHHNEESQIAVGNTIQQDLADIHTLVGTKGYFEQTCPILFNSTQTLTNAAANKDFIATNVTGPSGLISTDDAKVQKVMLVIIGRAVNSYAGSNALDCTTASHNQWRMNLDGGAYSDLVNEEADGQMLDNDWFCPVEGAIHPFTLMFDVTAQVTNIDGKIGVRLENGRSEQTSLVVTCDIFLKVLYQI